MLGAKQLPRGAQATHRRRRVVCVAAEGAKGTKKVVVIGGTGRVGSAAAASLLANFGAEYEVVVASRSRESYDKVVELRPSLKKARYVACDLADRSSVEVKILDCVCVQRVRG